MRILAGSVPALCTTVFFEVPINNFKALELDDEKRNIRNKSLLGLEQLSFQSGSILTF